MTCPIFRTVEITTYPVVLEPLLPTMIIRCARAQMSRWSVGYMMSAWNCQCLSETPSAECEVGAGKRAVVKP